MATLGVTTDFMRDLSRLDRPLVTKVTEVFAKFQEATHAGVHLERIADVRDPRLRSIRIDRFWRGVVLEDRPDSYLLLKVLPHDQAYAWAQRHRASVNRAMGGVEVRDAVALEEELPRLADGAPEPPAAALFAHVSDADLTRLGVDEEVRAFARTVTDLDQLERAEAALPAPQYDVLVGLASGLSVEEVWAETADVLHPVEVYDPDDLTAAAARSAGRVVLVTGPDELLDVLGEPFALWRVYLHPLQRRIAYGSYGGPARVTGGPGTGKTVVALHRVKHLASAAGVPDEAVLLTTFTRTLAESLDDGLRLLVEDDDVRRRVEVRHVDQVAHRIVAREHGRLRLCTTHEERQRWTDLLAASDLDRTPAFLAEEWRQVILAHGVRTRDAYLAVGRSGRGRPLGRRSREQVWDLVERFTRRLRTAGEWTYETITVEATRLVEAAAAAGGPRPYRHVVVDEAQDLSPWQWRFLRALVAPGRDDLFLAGDTHQRIYNHRVSLRRLGVEIAGRSERLRLNYRTTAEILGWSLGLLRGEAVDDMDGALDTLAGCRSLLHGPPPALQGFAAGPAELTGLVTTVRGWLDDGIEPAQIGVAARSVRLVDAAVAALNDGGVRAVSLGRRAAKDHEVPVATMHRTKGLEFRCVAVVGVDAQQVPPPSAVTPAGDDRAAHDLDLQRERCLLFVACTRAREHLAVTWSGDPSPLLP